MATNALRSLWAEPRPANAPDRGPRDWALVAALICWSVVEVVLRQDLAPRPLLLLAALAVLAPLPWRRTHPLVAVAVSFGTLTIVDIVRILTGSQGALPAQHLGDAGPDLRPVPVGLRSGGRKRPRRHPGLAAHHHTSPTPPAWPIRSRRTRSSCSPPRSAPRSAIARRSASATSTKPRPANANSSLASSTTPSPTTSRASPSRPKQDVPSRPPTPSVPSRPWPSSRTRRPAPSPSCAPSSACCAPRRTPSSRRSRAWPRSSSSPPMARRVPCVEVTLSGELDDLSPAVGAAIYRLAQESITNARRHARHATQVTVAVTGDADQVRLTVDDDGSAGWPAAPQQATAWWACGNAPHCSAAPSTPAPPPTGAGGSRRSCPEPGRHDDHQGPHRRRPAHRAHRADDAARRPTRHRGRRRGRRRARGSPPGAPAAPRRRPVRHPNAADGRHRSHPPTRRPRRHRPPADRGHHHLRPRRVRPRRPQGRRPRVPAQGRRTRPADPGHPRRRRRGRTDRTQRDRPTARSVRPRTDRHRRGSRSNRSPPARRKSSCR